MSLPDKVTKELNTSRSDNPLYLLDFCDWWAESMDAGSIEHCIMLLGQKLYENEKLLDELGKLRYTGIENDRAALEGDVERLTAVIGKLTARRTELTG